MTFTGAPMASTKPEFMASTKPKFNILVVDDNPDDCDFYVRVLSQDPDTEYTFLQADMGEDALEHFRQSKPDCVLLDYNLPDMDGIEFMQTLAEEFEPSCLPVVMLTGQGNEAVAVEAMKSGVRDYLVKGNVTSEALRRAIRNVIEKVWLERMNQQLGQQLQDANQDLKKKNEKLSQLTETAHRFVDNVAHDFRTPLTVIQEFSSIIADGLGGAVTDQQQEYLQYINTATRDLAQMVDDFLDSSKLKARVLRVDRKPQETAQIIRSVQSTLQTRAAMKEIELIEEVHPDLPLAFVDTEKIQRVIMNLAVNAIKFSPEGSKIVLWAKPHANGGVEVGVTDQGPGLTEEDVKVIFDRFKQVGDIQRASTKGFGLGLNIAKELVWLNLGEVDVTSERGQGSTFSFTLPSCDLNAILAHYFERLAELADSPESITVLQITTSPPPTDLESIRSFLASTCHPMDLILQLPKQEAILAIGSATESYRWISRLRTSWCAKHQGTNSEEPTDLLVQCTACVAYAEIKAADVPISLDQMRELRHSA